MSTNVNVNQLKYRNVIEVAVFYVCFSRWFCGAIEIVHRPILLFQFVEFVNCAAAGKDFMEKAKCLKDFRDCVSEACRIPEVKDPL